MDSYFRFACTGLGLRRKRIKAKYINGDGLPAPLPGFTGSILVDQFRPKGNWLVQILWDPSWTTEYTTRRKQSSNASRKANCFLGRENEAFRTFLAHRWLEPRQQEHAHVVTIRLGYGGVIWSAEKPPPSVGLATGASEQDQK